MLAASGGVSMPRLILTAAFVFLTASACLDFGAAQERCRAQGRCGPETGGGGGDGSDGGGGGDGRDAAVEATSFELSSAAGRVEGPSYGLDVTVGTLRSAPRLTSPTYRLDVSSPVSP